MNVSLHTFQRNWPIKTSIVPGLARRTTIPAVFSATRNSIKARERCLAAGGQLGGKFEFGFAAIQCSNGTGLADRSGVHTLRVNLVNLSNYYGGLFEGILNT